jgi:hypothetical protein
MSRMGRLVCVLCVGLVAATPARAWAQVTGITLQGPTSVASANDFASNAFQDPWDMSQRSDPGWWLNSVDYPYHGFSSISYPNGVFTGIVDGDPNTDPNVWLLESNSINLPPITKTGSTYPINANKYRIFAMRMRVSQPGTLNFLWSTQTMYDPPGLQPSGGIVTTAGWRIYFLDLATMGVPGYEPWAGTKRSLRLSPAPTTAPAGYKVEIDWVRLVDSQPSLFRTISWTNTGTGVDIYLDDDNNPTNNDPDQTLGLVAQGVTGSSYPLNVGALAPGTYYVAMRRSGTNHTFNYSTGAFQVNAPPLVTVTAPSDEGSSDDFATTQLNNPWDMTSASDIDHVINLQPGYGIGTVPNAETEAGASLGNPPAFIGVNTPGIPTSAPCGYFSKPVIYPLYRNARGALHHIDPTRYRILTAELGLPSKARDLCGGSIVRVVWHVAGETQESYSWGIALNSRAGANVINRLNLDVAALPIDPGSPSQMGWQLGFSSNPGIMSFRIDPHEFGDQTPFYVKRIKLAALETAHTSYTVRWTASKTAGTVSVYYDVDKDPAVKTSIGSVGGSATSLVWNTSGLPQDAQYYVYVEYNDGVNVNGAYSKWPIVIDHSPLSSTRLVPNRTTLNFGVFARTIKTPAQTLRLTTIGGQPCWTATADLPYLTVTPGSGCGSASLTVSLLDQSYSQLGQASGFIRITSSTASNSPQYVETVVRFQSTSADPFGVVDTPANGVTATGSLAITGWAADDIGIARVIICRDALSGEPPNPACGPGQVYIGDAVSIDDSRPDIEAFSPTSPLNYRAGWGFLILTNMMPNQGNGVFNLHAHAIDLEGRRALLGSRVIFTQNGSATEPFGTIDTPAQGETISGVNYPNFGWVLSRVRRADPPGGGFVMAYIDGVAVGTPSGWNKRADLSAAFPNYPGINTALGVLPLDTTAYDNGLHTIAWVVTDNGGVTSGIGSRFFTVFNTGSSVTSASVMRPAGPDLGRRVDELGDSVDSGSVKVREGFENGPVRSIARGIDGSRRASAAERDRLEIRLTSASSDREEYAGYLVVDGRLRELPTGSSFDPARGAFYWQPGLGYIGDYELLFVRTRADGVRERTPVHVTLRERSAPARASLGKNPWELVTFDR